MKTVNIHDAKTTLSRLLAEVERGEIVVIARNGEPIAELIAIRQPTLADGIQAIREKHKISIAGLSVRDLIDEGRH